MPTTIVGLVIFIALLAPGFAYALYSERGIPIRRLSTFRETSIVALASVLANLTSLAVFAALVGFFPRYTPDVDAFIQDPVGFFKSNYEQVFSWGLGLMIGAVLLALMAARLLPHVKTRAPIKWLIPPPPRDAYMSAWWDLFTIYEDAKVFVQCVMDDGSTVAGQLKGFSRESDDTADREFTLFGRIQYWPADSDEPHIVEQGAAAISARRLVLMIVSYIDVEHADEGPTEMTEGPGMSQSTIERDGA